MSRRQLALLGPNRATAPPMPSTWQSRVGAPAACAAKRRMRTQRRQRALTTMRRRVSASHGQQVDSARVRGTTQLHYMTAALHESRQRLSGGRMSFPFCPSAHFACACGVQRMLRSWRSIAGSRASCARLHARIFSPIANSGNASRIACVTDGSWPSIARRRASGVGKTRRLLGGATVFAQMRTSSARIGRSSVSATRTLSSCPRSALAPARPASKRRRRQKQLGRDQLHHSPLLLLL